MKYIVSVLPILTACGNIGIGDIVEVSTPPIVCVIDGGEYQKNVIWPGRGCPTHGACAVTDDDGGTVLGYGTCK
jgi:hypothetical protein